MVATLPPHTPSLLQFPWACCRIAAILLFWISTTHAHTVEQVFLSQEKTGSTWLIDITFDAAYALPEFRNDTKTSQPQRQWLLDKTPQEHHRLKQEAEKYIRECLFFTHDHETATYQVEFPDYLTSPPKFPHMLNGGAYITIYLSGRLVDNRTGPLNIHVASGERPSFVIATETNNTKNYHVINPGSTHTLYTITPTGHQLPAPSGSFDVLYMGFWHVLPAGTDHILFILALFLMARSWRPLLVQSLLFTIAHSITLGLAVSGFLPISSWSGSWLIEPLIAISIAAVAIENLFHHKISKYRMAIIFGFGLIHGLGFAGSLGVALQEGNPGLGSIALANLGVELAQISILAIAWILTTGWHKHPTYQKFRTSASLVITTIGIIWAIQRLQG